MGRIAYMRTKHFVGLNKMGEKVRMCELCNGCVLRVRIPFEFVKFTSAQMPSEKLGIIHFFSQIGFKSTDRLSSIALVGNQTTSEGNGSLLREYLWQLTRESKKRPGRPSGQYAWYLRKKVKMFDYLNRIIENVNFIFISIFLCESMEL